MEVFGPWLSVIIPTLNEENNIQGLLTYLHEHGGPEVEVLVVDGGSKDGTCQQVSEPAQLVQSVRGRAVQMNCGARQAQGKVLYFVHADTVPPTTYVADIRQAVAEGYTHGGYRFRFNSSKPIFRINDYFTRYDWVWTRGGDQTLFITRDFFDQLEGYDEHFVIMEEFDLLRRARKQGGKMKIFESEVLGSARKYQHNSYLRVNVANLIVFQGYRLGVAPEKLQRWYHRLLRHPKG